MRRLMWLGAWAAVAIWSLVAALVYGLVDFVGTLAMRNADMFSANPETVERIFSVFGWLRGLSTSIALVVWGVVSLAILAVPWFLDRVIGNTAAIRQPGRTEPAGRMDGIIDLDPDQYSVRPTPGAHPGPGGAIVTRRP